MPNPPVFEIPMPGDSLKVTMPSAFSISVSKKKRGDLNFVLSIDIGKFSLKVGVAKSIRGKGGFGSGPKPPGWWSFLPTSA